MTGRLGVAAWSLAVSVLVATVLWLSREHSAALPWLDYVYFPFFPAVMLAIVMSPNVHDPSDLLIWLAIVAQTFGMALLAAKITGAVRRSLRGAGR